jgi:hypothetical protein
MPVRSGQRLRQVAATAMITLLTAAAVGMTPAAGSASEPPTNDDLSGATTVTPLPFRDLFTMEFATRNYDTDLSCGEGGTIWYSFTAPRDMLLEVAMGSSYYFEPVVAVAREDGSSLTPLACQTLGWYGGPVQVAVEQGERYLFMVTGFYEWTTAWGGGEFVITEIAPPANDDFADAQVITGLPFSEEASTRYGTREPDDPTCGSSATSWFSYTPTADTTLAVRASSASFASPTLEVVTGTPGNFVQVACHQSFMTAQATFAAQAGVTYYLALSSAWPAETGTATVSVWEIPPPLTMQVAVASAKVSKAGLVTITGTALCNQTTTLAAVQVSATQSNRRFTARGQSPEQMVFICDTTPTTWTATFASDTGNLFMPGVLTVTTSGWSYNELYTVNLDPATVQVRAGATR